MINLKAIAITGGAAFLAGTFGGGIVMHKLMWGKAQADKLKVSEASLEAASAALDGSKAQAKKAAETAQKEAQARSEAEARLSRAYQDNAILAQSRASTTTRIIERGDEIGQELKGANPCIYEPWPDKLWDYAFDSDAAKDLLSPPVGGYPQGNESFIP